MHKGPQQPHRRYNPLLREWVLVSPHRTQRPWQGQVERAVVECRPEYDPTCYLCPGNERSGGARNPIYDETFVFENDFAALLPDSPARALEEGGLLQAHGVCGRCRVVCFSPRHDLTLAELPQAAIRRLLEAWAEEFDQLGRLDDINYVQIFENKGEMMGCSNPHPHGQIWASSVVPDEPARETESLLTYQRENGRCLLCDYLATEVQQGERLVCANDHTVALVPFWAVWPFETLLISRRHVTGLDELSEDERDALADMMKRLTTRYDNLFEVSFPYSMGWHQRPTDGAPHPECHLHAHYYPPLLRSATVRKFMVGYEMLAEPQRDLTAEAAAHRLRVLSEAHYSAARRPLHG